MHRALGLYCENDNIFVAMSWKKKGNTLIYYAFEHDIQHFSPLDLFEEKLSQSTKVHQTI